MISITDKHNCCGCEACVQVCPKHCISFLQDKEGFFYPEVDTSSCIQCGLCEKVCPVLTPYDARKPQEVLAAINPDSTVREQSSSGGVFTLLAEKVIGQGGVVFGVRFNDDWQAVFDFSETIDGLAAFRGSKYLQARVGDSFLQCKHFLDEGRQVLFSGTQCQIAGLRHFLGKPYSNLLAVDFVCHGVPSPKVWQRYLDEAVKAGRQAISDVQFRDKRQGWKRFSLTLNCDDSAGIYTLTSPFAENPFMRAFLSNLILRPSCHACPAKGGRSHADLTIADFWGIDRVNPEMDDDRGTSLVLVHTDKGQAALHACSFRSAKVTYDEAVRFNPSAEISVSSHPRREKFFMAFGSQTNLHTLIYESLRPSVKARIKRAVRHPLSFFKRLISRLFGGGKTALLTSPSIQDVSTLHISSIQFRSKQHGWKHYELQISLKDNY